MFFFFSFSSFDSLADALKWGDWIKPTSESKKNKKKKKARRKKKWDIKNYYSM